MQSRAYFTIMALQKKLTDHMNNINVLSSFVTKNDRLGDKDGLKQRNRLVSTQD
jgi:hypothetical protein